MQQLRVLVVDGRPARKSRLLRCLKTASDIVLLADGENLEDIKRLNLASTVEAILIGAELAVGSDFRELAAHAAQNGIAIVPISEFPLGATAPIRDTADCAEAPDDLVAYNRALLLETIVSAVADVASGRPPTSSVAAANARCGAPDPIIVIGASTGGVEALLTLLVEFPADCPPTLIVQHMKCAFIAGFTDRLHRACAPDVLLAEHGARLRRGTVFVAPGDQNHLELTGRHRPTCQLASGEPFSGHRPSVDRLFLSAAESRADVVGVLLTGMGRDGAEGLLKIREIGGTTIAQDAQSSVVYGMPRAAVELGAVQTQLPLNRIADSALSAAHSFSGRLR